MKRLNFFQEVLRIRPEDGPAEVLLSRCAWYLRNPPEKSWDGVHPLVEMMGRIISSLARLVHVFLDEIAVITFCLDDLLLELFENQVGIFSTTHSTSQPGGKRLAWVNIK